MIDLSFVHMLLLFSVILISVTATVGTSRRCAAHGVSTEINNPLPPGR
ncbi:hypothetical protein BIFGAL_03720 [Bifidobacterium gallicum DSM 20093 = LMG 11596]|uniref:Uncharacterized protein n=1 Tax=Bifidobacterium gallicum DSM 20093 = LMG 11596 TaxID=561180 RepID=D1NV37_9BIFI|nr:hypothetical protein BIFGAL_03720 [Bifidobacterium gallicum DSM 20093 = LMG 11596]